MTYYFTCTKDGTMEDAETRVTEALKAQGFGILTEIDVQKTLKEKLDLSFRRYRILGACNPPFAHKALSMDDKIGLLLPCNVIVQERSDGKIEISAINPLEAMGFIDNPGMASLAEQVSEKLKTAIDSL